VLFTDFVSFSSISETMTPEDLVQEIDECFSAFDEILEEEGVEKIKTIGDAYMCASGLNHTADHPEIRIVRVGLAIRDYMKARNEIRMERGLPYFQIRIGIHTGPVVAGVVGKEKFAYDIWGDTVNTASRMETNSQPGELNISASTYAMIKEAFVCEYRGMIEAKNKGELAMYFVRSIING
jgi:class 3 adenylate cyclase